MRQFMSITKALADENRVRIVMFLRHGELCLCQIIEMLQLAPSTVSKHMTVLQQAGLVDARKAGRWRYYRLPGTRSRFPNSRKAGHVPGQAALVKTALGWLLRALAEEPRSSEDDRRLQVVLKKDINGLCALYRSGRR